jgi:hypothetical protein
MVGSPRGSEKKRNGVGPQVPKISIITSRVAPGAKPAGPKIENVVCRAPQFCAPGFNFEFGVISPQTQKLYCGGPESLCGTHRHTETGILGSPLDYIRLPHPRDVLQVTVT